MRISATVNPVKISYKSAGCVYNATGSEGDASDSNGRTSAPFDEMTLAVGESFDFPEGTDIVSTAQMGPDSETNPGTTHTPTDSESVL